MDLVFERNDLSTTLQVLQGIASGKTTLPILSNIKFDADADGNIHLTATDLEVSIRRKVQGEVHNAGTITVSAKKLGDIVKELPNKPVAISVTSNDRVEMKCGDGVYKIIGLSSDEFPDVPTVEGKPTSIKGSTLINLLTKTEFAASTEEVRYFLNGLYFNFLSDRTEVAATDGKRLAVARCEPIDIHLEDEEPGFILPLKAVREIYRTFDESDDIEISVVSNQILFDDGKSTLVTRLIEGDYPNYQRIIPEQSESHAIVSKNDLLSAIRRVSLLSSPKNYLICLEIGDGEIHISAKTAEVGEGFEIVSVEELVGEGRIGFDARLLIEALSHIETQKISVAFSDALQPVVIKPTELDDYTTLIMPMRLEESDNVNRD